MAIKGTNEFLGRTYFVLGVFLILALVIVFKVFNVTIVEGEKWKAKGGVNVKLIPVETERGNVYAEDGRLLATSLPFFEIRMDLSRPSSYLFKEKIDSLSYLLSTYIDSGKSPRQWRNRLSRARNKKKPGYKYFPIAKKLDYDAMRLIKSFPIFRKGANRGGLIVVTHNKRVKPFGMLASRTVGVDRVNADKVGLEGYFDKALKGTIVKKLMKKIGGGIWVPVYDQSEFGVKKGSDIITNLDMDIQDVAESSLSESLVKYDADHGTAIVMEVKTGKIRAIANLVKDADGDIYEEKNYAVGELSEPGSTMKSATVLALLEDGYASADTKIDLYGGKRRFYTETMYDSHLHGIREVTMKKAFSISSNVGIGGLAYEKYEKLGKRSEFIDRIRQFGFGSMTNVEIVGEGIPDLKDPKSDKWWGTTIPWMAHGYEMLMTPLQILRFYNAVANDGVMMKPYLVSDIIGENGIDKHFKPKVVNAKIATKQNVAVLKDMLSDVVMNGTAKSLKTKKYNFSGKTGTTRVNYADKGADRKTYNASFAGYFPSEHPKYSVIVVVYDPKTKYYGAAVAGSVFRAIADKCFATKLDLMDEVVVAEREGRSINRKGYKKDFQEIFSYVDMNVSDQSSGDWIKVKNGSRSVKMNSTYIHLDNEVVPDIKGMGARDAVYLLESLGLHVETNGYGKVVKQSIKPGTKAVGQIVNLTLK